MLTTKIVQKVNIFIFLMFSATVVFCNELTEQWINYIENDKAQVEYYFNQLVEYCQNLTPDCIEADFNIYDQKLYAYFTKNTFHETNDYYDDISTKLRTHKKDLKSYIPLPLASSATKGNIYHASKIPLKHGVYIAAQGPNTISKNDFWAMLAENNIAISLSLVNNKELQNIHLNQVLQASDLGKNYVISSVIDEKTNDEIRSQHVICHLLSNKKGSFKYDLFLIDNKFHIRVYDCTWVKKQKYDTRRIIALACFTEKLRRLNIFKRSADAPIVINCNHGIGRTSILMLIMESIRSYVYGEVSSIGNNAAKNIVEKIMYIRHLRPRFAGKFSYFFKILECTIDPTRYLDHAINYFSLHRKKI
jgi:protein tyrosine phosphatase